MKRIDIISKEFIAPLLKTNGFKKKKLVWNRVRNNVIDIIEIDELRGSTADNERFVINVSTFVPSFFKVIWNDELKNFVQDADALLRLRLEDFCDETCSAKLNQSWIDLCSDEESSLGLEIVSVFEEKVLPYLNKIESFEVLDECYQNSNSRHKEYPLAQIQYALLKKETGCLDESRIILESLVSGKNQAWASRAQNVLSRI
jgi:hypothetical protein